MSVGTTYLRTQLWAHTNSFMNYYKLCYNVVPCKTNRRSSWHALHLVTPTYGLPSTSGLPSPSPLLSTCCRRFIFFSRLVAQEGRRIPWAPFEGIFMFVDYWQRFVYNNFLVQEMGLNIRPFLWTSLCWTQDQIVVRFLKQDTSIFN